MGVEEGEADRLLGKGGVFERASDRQDIPETLEKDGGPREGSQLLMEEGS